MITLADYFMGRDACYPDECTDEVRSSAAETVKRVNKFLEYAAKDGVVANKVSSGWRPKGINDITKNAAKRSNHVLAKAIDIADPGRRLAQWMIKNKNVLSLSFLWSEDPRWCARKLTDTEYAYWVHLQIVPPASGKLIYIPNKLPPTAPKLEGQKDLPLIRIL